MPSGTNESINKNCNTLPLNLKICHDIQPHQCAWILFQWFIDWCNGQWTRKAMIYDGKVILPMQQHWKCSQCLERIIFTFVSIQVLHAAQNCNPLSFKRAEFQFFYLSNKFRTFLDFPLESLMWNQMLGRNLYILAHFEKFPIYDILS